MTAPRLLAGAGRALITPPVGMPMGGWSNQLHERSAGNDLDLTVTALVVRNGETGVVMASLDLCLISDAQAMLMRHSISEAIDIPVEAIRITATHSHSAPVTGELTGAGWMTEGLEIVEPYMRMVTEALAGAAREAQSRLVPVTVGHGRGTSPLAVNRRMALAGSGVRIGHNWDGPVDPTVRVARLDADTGQAVATIVHYSAHPTILAGGNTYVTPEYPGVVRRVIEDSLGGRCLFLQGTPGNVGPTETFVSELEPYRRLGAMLGHEAAAVAHRATAQNHRQQVASGQDPSTWLTFFETAPQPPPDNTLRVERRIVAAPVRSELGDPVELRRRVKTLHAELRAALARGADPFDIRELRVQTKGASMRAERAEALTGLATYPLEIHGIRIGPLAFIGVPLEPFIELGLAIESRSPFPATFVSGYTNGYRNYLPTVDAWSIGGYEVDSCSFRPETADLFVEGAVAVLGALAD
jgi:Neutral/alkaline non-lysosomal ceramidase, N-terminal